MNSVLLGGLKVFLVNDGGKPLSAPGGRAKFYLAGTSTPETVYSDIDLTAADAHGPVVYTNELGYLPAIWLKTDRLYKVRVEQKISDDPEAWSLLWEVDNVGYLDTSENEVAGSAAVTVGSIAELKLADHDEHSGVLVTGYYEEGDWGEPSLFVWDAENTKTPDNGAYVLPADQQQSVAGRWVQVFSGDVLDVRKFGALPDMDDNSDVTAKVVNAVNYSQDNSTRTRPITVGFVAPGRYDFSGNFDFSQYYFVDLSDNSTHYIKWFIGQDVVFNNILDSQNTFTLAKDTVCLATGTLVSGTTALAVEGGGSIRVNPAWWGGRQCTVSDCIVDCPSVTTNRKIFTSCRIESDGMLGGYVSLTDCDVWQGMFAASMSFDSGHLELSSCRIHGVWEWNTVSAWAYCKNANGDADLDFQGKGGVTIALSYDSGVITIRNAVDLTVSVTGALPGVQFIGCTGTYVTVPYDISALSFDGGSVASVGNTGGTSTLTGTSVSLRDTVVSGNVMTTTTGIISLFGCTLVSGATVHGGAVSASSCTGYSGSALVASVSGTFDRCTLNTLTAVEPSITDCNIGTLNMQPSSGATAWTCSILRSRVETMYVSNSSSQVPAFTFISSQIHLASFTQYEAQANYSKLWTCDGCIVTGPNGTSFEKVHKVFFDASDRKVLTGSGGISYYGIPVPGMLTFEALPDFTDNSAGDPLLTYGYRALVTTSEYTPGGDFVTRFAPSNRATLCRVDGVPTICIKQYVQNAFIASPLNSGIIDFELLV